MNLMSLSFLVAVAGLVSACGGGGGSGSAAIPPVASALLTGSNQSVAAQDALAVSFMPMMGVEILTGVRSTDESVLFGIARIQMEKLPGYLAQASVRSVLTGVIQTDVVPCTFGGTLTVSVSDPDNNGLVSAGDRVLLSSNNCSEPEGALTGSLGFLINSLNGAFGSTSYSAGLTMSFGGFSVSSSQFSASVNGDLALAVNVNGAGFVSASVASSALAVSGTYAGLTRTRSLSDYSATFARSPHPSYSYDFSYTASGTLVSSALSSQAISFATSTPFTRHYSDVYPSSGVMLLTGASNSRLKLTAVSSILVQQQLDADGDGVFEGDSPVRWDTLM